MMGNPPVKLCQDKDCCPTAEQLSDKGVRITSDNPGGEGELTLTPENASLLKKQLEAWGY